QTSRSYRGTCTGRLVHLAEYERTFRFFQELLVDTFSRPFAFFHAFHKVFTVFDNTRFQHLAKQIISFTCTLTYTGKYRKTTMSFCNIIDQFLDQYGLTYTCTTKCAVISPRCGGL